MEYSYCIYMYLLYIHSTTEQDLNSNPDRHFSMEQDLNSNPGTSSRIHVCHLRSSPSCCQMLSMMLMICRVSISCRRSEHKHKPALITTSFTQGHITDNSDN